MSTVIEVYLTNLIVDHKLLVETVAFRSLVIGVHQVVDRHGFRTVLLTNPVRIRQVDTYRRSRIAIARQNSRGDHFGAHALHFLFLVFRIGCGVVLKPLCVLRNQLCTLGRRQVLEVHHRLPCAGDTKRVGVGLRKTVHKVHTALQIFHPCNAILVEELEITRLIEGDQLLQYRTLLVVLYVFLRLFEPIDYMLQRFAIETAYFINALFNLTLLVLHQLAIQTDPQRFRTVVLMRRIPCFGLSLRHTFAVVVSSRTCYQVHTVLCGHSLRHHVRIEHHRQNSGVVFHSGILTSSYKPILRKLRQELILAVMMMDTIGEPDALEILLKDLKLCRTLLVRIVEIQCLARTTDTQVVTSVLVKQDITSPQRRLTQAINQLLLLQRQTIELRHIVAQDLQVIKLIHVILERSLLLWLAGTKHYRTKQQYLRF